MKVTLVLAAFCVAATYAEPAISQARTTTTTSTKPGRFLSLPVPAKCASRKYFFNLTFKTNQSLTFLRTCNYFNFP